MSNELIIYTAIAASTWVVALLLVKTRNAMDLGRCVGWYLLVFLATYVIRPAASQITGDTELYQLLRLGSFEDHWQLMAVAVPLAILSFAIGYSLVGRSTSGRSAKPLPSKNLDLSNRRVLVLSYWVIAWGYFSSIISLKTGVFGGDVSEAGGMTIGGYEHSTAWFAQGDLFISVGSILYYIITGRLGMSLFIAAPWMAGRLVYGWGRSHLLGHFFALMAIYFLKTRVVTEGPKKSRQVLVIGSAVLVMLMLFPALSMLRGLKKQLHMDAASFSKDALQMVQASASPQDMLQTYLGTNSSIAGFELSMSHLAYDKRSSLGTTYFWCYFIKPIPRMLWPGKGAPGTLAENWLGVQYDPVLQLIGAAPGSIGMAYMEWGWLGIIFEFIFTGWVIHKAEEAVRQRGSPPHVVLAYAGLYSMLPQLGRDSLLYMISAFWLFPYGVTVLLVWLVYKSAAERVQARSRVLAGGASAAAAAPGTINA